MDTFVEETEGFSSNEEIPEAQVCGVGGQISVDRGHRVGLDFDDHMVQLQQRRNKYRIFIPILHVISIANESHTRIP